LKAQPIRIRFLVAPRAQRGKLLSGGDKGVEVHAGAFLHNHEIVLDSALLEQPRELGRILVHEVFHFVWWKLGNQIRRSFEELLRDEIRRGVHGELGWSAEMRKQALSLGDVRHRTKRWREYVCESFCDSAAWLAVGSRLHAEITLDCADRQRRRHWFYRMMPGSGRPL